MSSIQYWKPEIMVLLIPGRDRFWSPDRKYMDSITTAHPELILLDAQQTTIIRNNRFRCDHGWDIDRMTDLPLPYLQQCDAEWRTKIPGRF